MKSIALAAALALLAIPAMADCPGGESATCSTGSVHRLGANQTCFKVQFTPMAGVPFLAAIRYDTTPVAVGEGLEKMLQEGAALSLITNGMTFCGSGADGAYQVISGTRAVGY
jgi:hypothetical protein